MPTETKTKSSLDERLAANLDLAIALRCLSNYLNARDTVAQAHGMDVSDLPTMDDKEIRRRYEKILDEWLGETPDSSETQRAFVSLALVILLDGRLTPILNAGTIVGDEKDIDHVMRLLEAVHTQLERQATADYIHRKTSEAQERIETAAREGRL